MKRLDRLLVRTQDEGNTVLEKESECRITQGKADALNRVGRREGTFQPGREREPPAKEKWAQLQTKAREVK